MIFQLAMLVFEGVSNENGWKEIQFVHSRFTKWASRFVFDRVIILDAHIFWELTNVPYTV